MVWPYPIGRGGDQRTRGFWNEDVARHMEHRVQHARVMDALFVDSRSSSRRGSGLPALQVNAALRHAARSTACCTTYIPVYHAQPF